MFCFMCKVFACVFVLACVILLLLLFCFCFCFCFCFFGACVLDCARVCFTEMLRTGGYVNVNVLPSVLVCIIGVCLGAYALWCCHARTIFHFFIKAYARLMRLCAGCAHCLHDY